MKHTLSLTLALLATTAAWGNPNWKMHNTFDEEITRLVDTDKYTYFISRTQTYMTSVATNNTNLFSLFRYDKEMDELLTLSTDNELSNNVVQCIEYSPEKGMLVVVYANHDIDLLYDNGKTANIPAYRMASVASGKDVNSIFIDADRDRIYLSTGFGYVALNDKKLEVAESRNYGQELKGMSRIGDRLLILTDSALLEAPLSDPRFNLSDYAKISDLKSPIAIAYLSDERSVVTDTSGSPHNLYMVERDGDGLKLTERFKGKFFNIEHNRNGLTVALNTQLVQFYPDGSREAAIRMESDYGTVASSHDMREIWFGEKRKGICSKRHDPDAATESAWTLTRDFMLPNSPAPFRATDMKWHPEYGMLVVNHGYDRNFTASNIPSPILLSAYKGGMWTNLSPVYTWPEGTPSLMNPTGLGVDPNDQDKVYFGSVLHGIERINLKDGADILHMSRTSDPYREQPGFVEIVSDMVGPNAWKAQCMFSAPEFDAYGNMWVAHFDSDDQNPKQTHLFCWPSANRLASADPTSFRPMTLLKKEGLSASNFQILKPLTTSRNRDILVWTSTSYHGALSLIHTNGTPADGSDDKVVSLTSFYDQDGASFDLHEIMDILEDPLTGNVWVAHVEGVFYFNPSDILDGKQRVTRIKVARNDGTNLADYLLDLVKVNRMAIDGQGRKWFATAGAGLVCTSSDGRTIEEELTTANSPLPDDIVYGIGYNPENNSMMISTESGIAEYFLTKGGGSGTELQVRAYPNPVRPDYFGYVTIDGLPDGSLVKIADSRGNLVKELGHISGGEVKWDVTDMSFRRVGSGVYFILASTDETGGQTASVGKILVVN